MPPWHWQSHTTPCPVFLFLHVLTACTYLYNESLCPIQVQVTWGLPKHVPTCTCSPKRATCSGNKARNHTEEPWWIKFAKFLQHCTFLLHIGCRVCPMQFYMAYSLTGLCQDFIVYTLWGLLSHYLVIPLRQLVAPQVTTTLSPSLLPNLSTCSLSHNYTLLHYSVHHFYIWNNVIPS